MSNALPEPDRLPMRSSRGRVIAAWAAKIVGSMLIMVLGLVILGAFFPDLFGLGVVGAILSGWSTWLGITALVGLGASVWLLIRRRGIWRGIIAGVAAATVSGCTVITTQLVALGAEQGVAINPFGFAVSTPSPDDVVSYGDHDGQSLDVSVWRPANGSSEDAPVAFITHGGGWTSGSPAEIREIIPALTDAGWLVVAASYTLATPESRTVDFVEDQIGCAMAWTQANAATYGGNVSTFVAMGDSAGGNLAINTAYRSASGDLTCATTGAMPDIDAVAVVFPAVDPVALWNDSVTGGLHPGQTFLEQYIGGSPTDFPLEYEAVASAPHVTPTSPPTLILQGANDHLVQAHAVADFAANTQAAGVDMTYISVPYGEHVFQFTPLGSQLYTSITLNWLHEQGLSSGAPRE
jgi:acetyl esterase